MGAKAPQHPPNPKDPLAKPVVPPPPPPKKSGTTPK